MILSIVIPVYNEEERIIPTLEKLKSDFIKDSSDIEILVGDDGSIDDTASVVKEFANHNSCFKLIHKESNRGKGAILRDLVAKTSGDIVLYTDADLPVNPLEFDLLINPILKGEAELVQVSRWLKESPKVTNLPIYRSIISQLFRFTISKMKPKGITDTQCGCKAFEGDLARKIFSTLFIDGFAFDVELLLSLQSIGGTIVEVPLQVNYVEGSSVRPINAALTMVRDLIRIKRHHYQKKNND